MADNNPDPQPEGSPRVPYQPLSRLCIASFIAGFAGWITCFMAWPVSLLAIPLGHLALWRTRGTQVRGREFAWTGIGLGYAIILLVFAPLFLGRYDCPPGYLAKLRKSLAALQYDVPPAKSRRVNCAGNLKRIGLALQMYCEDNSGWFPLTPPGNNFEPLNTGQILTDGHVYGCPSVLADSGVAFSEVARQSNYRYLGSGLRADDPDAALKVIAHDEADNHCGRWLNALFVDGHVDGCAAANIEAAGQQRGWLLPGPNTGRAPPSPAAPPAR